MKPKKIIRIMNILVLVNSVCYFFYLMNHIGEAAQFYMIFLWTSVFPIILYILMANHILKKCEDDWNDSAKNIFALGMTIGIWGILKWLMLLA